MNQLLKLILAGILVLSLLKMPYLFTRLSGYMLFAGFAWLAYDGFQRRDSVDVKVFALLAILFNPFFIFPLPHFIWVIIIILVIIGMVLNILFAEDNPYENHTKKDDQ